MSKRGEIELDTLGWIIIAAAVLFIIIAAFLILKGKGVSALDFIRNIFRFGGP